MTPARQPATGRPAANRADPARAPRADAQRNIAAILDAALECLTGDPDATVAQIAQRAGVGRVTLYGHFSTRAELVDAVFGRVVAESKETLDAVDTGGEAADALVRLIIASWQIVHRYRAVLAAAERELPAERVRRHHDPHLAMLTSLIRRGQGAGAFRTDVPEQWLVTTAFALMHAAAGEVRAGRLDAADAQRSLVATLLGAYAPPPATPTDPPASPSAR